jgi:hypothetical protein
LQQAAGDCRLEQRVTVEDQAGALQRAAGHPATGQVVCQLVEGIEQGTHADARDIEAGYFGRHQIVAETGDHHRLANVVLGQGAHLPFEHAAASEFEQALGRLLRVRQQPAALAGAQDEGAM